LALQDTQVLDEDVGGQNKVHRGSIRQNHLLEEGVLDESDGEKALVLGKVDNQGCLLEEEESCYDVEEDLDDVQPCL
jgi:hypothetical protein